MAEKGKGNRAFPAVLAWRVAFVAGIIACAVLGYQLWRSGNPETAAASKDGRRLIVHLEDGSVEGMPSPASASSEESSSSPPPLPESASSSASAISSSSEAAVVPSSEVPEGAQGDLLAASEEGALPKIGADGTKPWRAYAKSFQREGKKPIIAIVITGLGQSKSASNAAIRLPQAVTLSFSPYAHDLTSWMTAARTSGHELMLDLPLEPTNFPAVDPGPDGLLTSKSAEDNAKSLHRVMARAGGYIGFALPQNESYSLQDELFKALLQELGQRGLLTLISHEPAGEHTKQILTAASGAHITADQWIDEELVPQAIQERLKALEQIAKDNGAAVGMAQAYPLTMQQLAQWAQELDAKGITLAPVSAVAREYFK